MKNKETKPDLGTLGRHYTNLLKKTKEEVESYKRIIDKLEGGKG